MRFIKRISTPLTLAVRKSLRCGEEVFLSGIVYTARDVAHKRLNDIIKTGKKIPFDLKDEIIYYAGPTPERDDGLFGSCGPTTSSRMDRFTPLLIKSGLGGMIGKGKRSEDIIRYIRRFKSIYFVTIGGAGAYLAKCIKKIAIVAFQELGPEGIYKLEVKDFPLIVAVDTNGCDIYYRLKWEVE